MIKCCKCKVEKDDREFSRDRTNSKGRCSTCKDCKAKYKKEYLSDPLNRKKQLAYHKKYEVKIKDRNNIINHIKAIKKPINEKLLNRIIKKIDKERLSKQEESGTKTCVRCKQIYSIDKFHIKGYKKINGELVKYRNNFCSECSKDSDIGKNRKFRKTRKYKNYIEKYRKSEKYKNSLKSDEWKKRNRLKNIKRRDRKIKLNEVISFNDIEYLKKQFDYKCYNCGSEEKLEIDHYYPLSAGFPLTIDNGLILCRKCNTLKNNRFPDHFFSPSQILVLEVFYNKIDGFKKCTSVKCVVCNNDMDLQRPLKKPICSKKCRLEYNRQNDYNRRHKKIEYKKSA